MSNRVIPMEMSNAQGNLGNNLNIKEAETNTTATYSTSFNVCLLLAISITIKTRTHQSLGHQLILKLVY